MQTGSVWTPKLDGSAVFYAPLWRPDMVAQGGGIVNGTGICTGSPINLAVGANTVTVTQAGTFTVYMPEGGTVATGTMTVDGSPVTIPAGIATAITASGATGNITVTPSNIIRSKDRNNLAMTAIGALWTPQGRSTDANDDKIVIADAASLRLSNMTFIAWVYKSGTTVPATAGYIVSKFNSVGMRGWNLWHYNSSDNKFYFQAGDGIAVWPKWVLVSDTAYAAAGWYHVAITNDGSNMRIYVNGVADGSLASGAIAQGADDLWIGRSVNNNDYTWGGTIGETLYSNRALALPEIQNHRLSTMWRYS